MAGGLSAEAARAGRACGRGRRSPSPTSMPTSRCPAVGVTAPGTMVAVMGTSTCHLVLGDRLALAEGMCGVVEDGIIPGLFGYEAGQSAVGDIFGWFIRTGVPPEVHEQARRDGTDVHRVLERDAAARLRPGESGLVALDWWNGNRSILVDVDLSGLLLGATLATGPADIYRALLESTVFGTRRIIESLESAGVAIDRIVACGGLPDRNGLLMQLTADITGREVRRRGVEPGARPGLGDVRRGRGRGRARRLRLDRGGRRGDGQAARPDLPAGRRHRERVRPAVPRVRRPARLLRARRQRRDEAPAGDPRRGLGARPRAAEPVSEPAVPSTGGRSATA